MTHPLLPRHAAIVGIALALSFPSLAAQVPAQEQLSPETAAGSYLAARHAGAERDSAAAAAYYLDVLKLDPHNPDLLSRTFLSVLTEGNVDEASKLGERLLTMDHSDRIARLVLGIRDLKQKRYASARQNFAQSVRGPVTDLTAALLTAWAQAGGATRTAQSTRWTSSPGPTGTEFSRIYMPGSFWTSATTRKAPADDSQAPTKPILRLCARCKHMAVTCRARATRTAR